MIVIFLDAACLCFLFVIVLVVGLFQGQVWRFTCLQVQPAGGNTVQVLLNNNIDILVLRATTRSPECYVLIQLLVMPSYTYPVLKINIIHADDGSNKRTF